jgi:hypothetical protein
MPVALSPDNIKDIFLEYRSRLCLSVAASASSPQGSSRLRLAKSVPMNPSASPRQKPCPKWKQLRLEHDRRRRRSLNTPLLLYISPIHPGPCTIRVTTFDFMRVALNIKAQSFRPDFTKYQSLDCLESLLNYGGTSASSAEIGLGWARICERNTLTSASDSAGCNSRLYLSFRMYSWLLSRLRRRN